MRTIVFAMVVIGVLSAPAYAVPVTYEFAGSGQICTHSGGTACYYGAVESFTGTVTIDVIGAPTIFEGDPPHGAYGPGWVHSDFVIQWAANTFSPGPVSDQNEIVNQVQVWNDRYGVDRLYNRLAYQADVGWFLTSFASLERSTHDTSWLDELEFDAGKGLASGPYSYNYLRFGETRGPDWDPSQYWFGYEGLIFLSSLTPQTTPVPEPGTLALWSLGLAGFGLVRRRRASGSLATPVRTVLQS